MNKEIKQFIENNIDLIDNNEWRKIYLNIASINPYIVGEFTRSMLECGINPLNPNSSNLHYIPMAYLIDDIKINSFTIPEGIKGVRKASFFNCINLKEITIPKSCKEINESAFKKCINLTNIKYQGTVKDWDNPRFMSYYPSSFLGVGTNIVHCIDGDTIIY